MVSAITGTAVRHGRNAHMEDVEEYLAGENAHLALLGAEQNGYARPRIESDRRSIFQIDALSLADGR
jgi:hypothetical protein